MVKCYTNDQILYETTMDGVDNVGTKYYLLCVPMYVKALALQKAASYINLIGAWDINYGCVYFFSTWIRV